MHASFINLLLAILQAVVAGFLADAGYPVLAIVAGALALCNGIAAALGSWGRE